MNKHRKDTSRSNEGPATLSEDPNLVPGQSRKHLAPVYYHMLTAEPRDDVDVSDEALWLKEEPLDYIDKQGIRLANQWFFSLRLQEFVSGPKGTPRRNLYIQYNRALLARGVLKEIRVVEKDPQGRTHELFRCRRREEVLDELDVASAIRERNAYVRDLLAKRAIAEDEYLLIQEGTEIFNQRVAEHLARERLRRNDRPEPMPARPIFDEDEAEDQERESKKEYRRRLADKRGKQSFSRGRRKSARRIGRASAAGESPSTAPELEQREQEDNTQPQPAGPAKKRPKTQSSRSTKPSLGRALGGRTGFQRHTKE